MRPERHALAKPLADAARGDDIDLCAGDRGSGAAAGDAAVDAADAGDDRPTSGFVRVLIDRLAQTMSGFGFSHVLVRAPARAPEPR
jgi:hypothetical protein